MSNIILFEEKHVRRAWNQAEEKWYFAVVDVIAILTGSPNPQVYWRVMKKRLRDEGNQTVTNCNALKMTAADGKQRLTDVADTEQLLRLIQSIPSPKAEPCKLWLAQVGYERLEEIENPELAAKRTREIYEQKGYSEEWIEKRMRGIAVRDELTDEWKKRGAKEQREYAILTAEISKATFGMRLEPLDLLRTGFCPSVVAGKVVGIVVSLDLAFGEGRFKLKSFHARNLRGCPDGHCATLVKSQRQFQFEHTRSITHWNAERGNCIVRDFESQRHGSNMGACCNGCKSWLQRGRTTRGAEWREVGRHATDYGTSSTEPVFGRGGEEGNSQDSSMSQRNWFTSLSENRMPLSRICRTKGATFGIAPASFALSKTPSVPIGRIPRDSAALLARRSSSKTSAENSEASAMASDSPSPIRLASFVAKTRSRNWTTRIHSPRSRSSCAIRASSHPVPSVTSSRKTAGGTISSARVIRNKSILPTEENETKTEVSAAVGISQLCQTSSRCQCVRFSTDYYTKRILLTMLT
jgi:hypothetical protein